VFQSTQDGLNFICTQPCPVTPVIFSNGDRVHVFSIDTEILSLCEHAAHQEHVLRAQLVHGLGKAHLITCRTFLQETLELCLSVNQPTIG
jgi:hypothetical protein